MKIDFTGRTALVTGATRGIGAAIARVLQDAGARLILTGTDEEQIKLLNTQSDGVQSDNIQYVAADFSEPASLETFLEFINRQERIDICVNNAGINIIKPVDAVDDNDLDKLLDINLRAPYLISRSVAGKMKKAGYGRIINIASIWGVISKTERTIYSTAKTGLVGMTRSFAVELADSNILINAVSPGFINTELTQNSLSEQERAGLAAQVPMLRFGNPEEIAQVVAFLGSELNTYITGQNIIVDGGFTCV